MRAAFLVRLPRRLRQNTGIWPPTLILQLSRCLPQYRFEEKVCSPVLTFSSLRTQSPSTGSLFFKTLFFPFLDLPTFFNHLFFFPLSSRHLRFFFSFAPLLTYLPLAANRRWPTTRKAIGTRQTGHEQPALRISAVTSFNFSLVDIAHVDIAHVPRAGAASPPTGCAAAPHQRCLRPSPSSHPVHGQCRAHNERFDGHASVLEERHVDCAQLAANVSAQKCRHPAYPGGFFFFSFSLGFFLEPLIILATTIAISYRIVCAMTASY